MRSPDVSSFKWNIQGDHAITEVLISSWSADIGSRSDEDIWKNTRSKNMNITESSSVTAFSTAHMHY